MKMVKFVVFALFVCFAANDATTCKSRDYGNGSPVCVCDEKSCDSVEPVEPVPENRAVVYTSDKSGKRLERTLTEIQSAKASESPDIILDTTQKFQSIEGFGGAFTDATGINIGNLPAKAQEFLLRSYYSQDGIEYTVGRIPLSSTDFSTRRYSYDDVPNDFNLTHFALAEEDLKYKIPFINAAKKYSNRPIKFFGSSWSAPAWMKNSVRMEGNGTLLGQPTPNDPYYTTFANYYVKFLQEYAKHDITFWALTAQNEPTTGFLYDYGWQTQAYTPEMQRDFIKNNLGPALQNNGFKNVSIMILDDNRFMLPSWARKVLNDVNVRQYVSHIAVHYYVDQYTPAAVLDATHDEFPTVPLFGTEACIEPVGSLIPGPPVLLGSWERAEKYCNDIIEDLNHWFTGWTDWNLALNEDGGPNWAKNNVDSPIIVNATSGEFYKQPMFYALGHFSKFLPPKSYRIGMKLNLENKKIEATSFINADGYKTVILMNKDTVETKLTIADSKKNDSVDVALPARSFVTVLWK